MPIDEEAVFRTRKILRGVGKIAGYGFKEIAKTTWAGIKGVSGERPEMRRMNAPERRMEVPRYSSGLGRQPSMKSVSQPGRYGKVPKTRQSSTMIDNPFPKHVSDELGIPHRDQISMRDYELIRKDVIRRGL